MTFNRFCDYPLNSTDSLPDPNAFNNSPENAKADGLKEGPNAFRKDLCPWL